MVCCVATATEAALVVGGACLSLCFTVGSENALWGNVAKDLRAICLH